MEGLSAVGFKVVDLLASVFGGLRRVRVQAHHGVMLTTGEPCIFLNVTNLSRNRFVEITHITFETRPPISVVTLERPLPRRLAPDESWETWLPLAAVDTNYRGEILTLGRVRLSSGRTIPTHEGKEVPNAGQVPGP